MNKRFKGFGSKTLLIFLCGLVLFGGRLFAQPSVEIEGVIKNGTTGKPVKGQRILLISPSKGMEELASVESDGEGRFKFERTQGPFFVVQTHFQGANYNQPVQPQERGLTRTTLTVYDATASDANVSVTRAQWRMVPESGKLNIDEVFEVVNKTDPPRTLVRSDGSFKFGAPAGATVENASLEEAAGMPLPQTPREITPGKLFAIDHPIQPGTTRIGIRFTADYSSQSYSFSQKLANAPGEIDLFLPKDMQVNSIAGFEKSSADTQGYQVYAARGKRAGDDVTVNVAGGSAPAAGSDSGMGEEAGTSSVTQLPNAIGAIQVPLVGLLGLLMLWSLSFAIFQRREPSKKSEGPPPGKKKQLTEQKDYLVRRIIELDQRFAAKEIMERDYHLQRSRLKSKCAGLMRLLQPVPARKREKTVA
ncbi:MAG: hypothetical protein LAO31_05120 [Acidobacteriia bacterium]|nr:hypothetical protein [Terriglobia bacterium]